MDKLTHWRLNLPKDVQILDNIPSWSTFCAMMQKTQDCVHHWILLAENHEVQAAWSHPLCNTLNPRGISLYALSDKQTIWVFPNKYQHLIFQHFPFKSSNVNDNGLPENPKSHHKPWFKLPQNHQNITRVLVVGGGIAAATTARALANCGVMVSVFTDNAIACAASGNRQGLLYAKISAHDTMQSRLLLQAYGYALSLLQHILPESEYWQQCGVLHISDSKQEYQRNQKIAEQNCCLYCLIDPETASQLSGIPMEYGGLFWPFGAWIHPPALVKSLLTHPNIDVYEYCAISNAEYENQCWRLSNNQQCFSGSHLVLCTGAKSHLITQWGLHISPIRGQTTVCVANTFSSRLRIALSGSRYISPSWQNKHCFGATFHPNNDNDILQNSDNQMNLQALKMLNSSLYHSFANRKEIALSAHAAVRADAYDHLPMVGAVGDAVKMRSIYAKLADDKNYGLQAACPFLPNAYVNIAHGSRGLLTAPLSAAAVAAEIMNTIHPFSDEMRAALSPNRLIIRDIIKSKEQ